MPDTIRTASAFATPCGPVSSTGLIHSRLGRGLNSELGSAGQGERDWSAIALQRGVR